jgi:hypothetical protein
VNEGAEFSASDGLDYVTAGTDLTDSVGVVDALTVESFVMNDTVIFFYSLVNEDIVGTLTFNKAVNADSVSLEDFEPTASSVSVSGAVVTARFAGPSTTGTFSVSVKSGAEFSASDGVDTVTAGTNLAGSVEIVAPLTPTPTLAMVEAEFGGVSSEIVDWDSNVADGSVSIVPTTGWGEEGQTPVGYNIDVSSHYSTADGWKLFDGKSYDATDHGWHSEDNTFVDGEAKAIIGTSPSLTVGDVVTYGQYVTIELPSAEVITHFAIGPREERYNTIGLPADYQLVGSNNGSAWTSLCAISGEAPISKRTVHALTTMGTSYTHYGILVTKTGDISWSFTYIGELELLQAGANTFSNGVLTNSYVVTQSVFNPVDGSYTGGSDSHMYNNGSVAATGSDTTVAGPWLDIDLGEDRSSITSYRIYLPKTVDGNRDDGDGKDPLQWVVSFRADGGEVWYTESRTELVQSTDNTNITEETVDDKPVRYVDVNFAPLEGDYRFARLVLTKSSTVNGGSAVVAISEFDVYASV